MAVDILPTALPLDASTHFSNVLTPYLETLIADYKQPGSQSSNFQEALDRATIAKEGQLIGKHAWLGENVSKWRESIAAADTENKGVGAVRKKKVLLLGSGMVAGPAIDEICKRQDIELIVGALFLRSSDLKPAHDYLGSNLVAEAEKLTRKHSNATALLLDMSDSDKVSNLISQADVVIRFDPPSTVYPNTNA